MGWVGLDDTDSPEGGCTTWDMHLLLQRLEDSGFNLTSPPRLVRLWPHAPRRTRGNAALSAQLDDAGREEELLDVLDDWFKTRFSHLSGMVHPDDGTTPSPSMVWSREQLPSDWYWSAVRGWVDPTSRRESLLEREGVRLWTVGRIDGVVGASSAIAWPADIDWTWEATSWRQLDNLRYDRMVPTEHVEIMSDKFPRTILNRDPNATRSLIAPRTPCPVLYGIRAEDEESARGAHEWLQRQEGVERAVAMRVHQTNQATGDHLDRIHTGVGVAAVVDRKGGHASVDVVEGGVRTTLVAFAEGGPVNRLLRLSRTGDRLSWNGTIAHDGSVHLENLRIDDGVPRDLNRPVCGCGHRFRRKGVSQPLSCPSCSERAESHWLSAQCEHEGSWVEPMVSQRRHLSRPLSREPKM